MIHSLYSFMPWCPLGSSSIAPCTLAAFISQFSVLSFFCLILVVTVSHRLFQVITQNCGSSDDTTTQRAGGSSTLARLALLLLVAMLVAVCYFGNNSQAWACIPVPSELGTMRAVLLLTGTGWVVMGCAAFLAVHYHRCRLDDSAHHKLARTGLYRLARHPILACLLWTLPGILLATLSWTLPLASLAVLVLLLLPTLPQEECSLEAHFGDEYVAYQSQVPPLGPGTQWLTNLYSEGTCWRQLAVNGSVRPRVGLEEGLQPAEAVQGRGTGASTYTHMFNPAADRGGTYTLADARVRQGGERSAAGPGTHMFNPAADRGGTYTLADARARQQFSDNI